MHKLSFKIDIQGQSNRQRPSFLRGPFIILNSLGLLKIIFTRFYFD